MTNCKDPLTCKNGDCIGCNNGNVWCLDPRCAPYCSNPSCVYPYDHDFNANMVIVTILLCLFTIFFIVWFIYGPQLIESHSDHARAGVIMPSDYKD